ncbi:MAG: hypothetical protein J6J21_03120 [Clostridia bacterium]|nr:hypothetical protein [Clostridia bacterium]
MFLLLGKPQPLFAADVFSATATFFHQPQTVPTLYGHRLCVTLSVSFSRLGFSLLLFFSRKERREKALPQTAPASWVPFVRNVAVFFFFVSLFFCFFSFLEKKRREKNKKHRFRGAFFIE